MKINVNKNNTPEHTVCGGCDLCEMAGGEECGERMIKAKDTTTCWCPKGTAWLANER